MCRPPCRHPPLSGNVHYFQPYFFPLLTYLLTYSLRKLVYTGNDTSYICEGVVSQDVLLREPDLTIPVAFLLQVYMGPNTFIHTCIQIHTIHTNTYIHTHNTYVHTCMHTYIHTYIHTYFIFKVCILLTGARCGPPYLRAQPVQ